MIDNLFLDLTTDVHPESPCSTNVNTGFRKAKGWQGKAGELALACYRLVSA